MGTFVFKWEHPASEVFVTGTFDNWKPTQKLHKKGDIFEKEVTLPSTADKIYYKFVVDGNWVTDHTAPQEKDQSGNINNVLTTDRIKGHSHTPSTAGIMSGVTPNSTTAQLAKDVPKENGAHADLPGTFPETPATEPAGFSVNPIPASEGAGNPVNLAPGEAVPAHNKINSNTIASTVHDDEELKAADAAKEPTFGVNPIPATAGAGNPIQLAPGEAVPAHNAVTSNTISSTVHDDEELKAADAAKEPTFGVSPIPATAGAGNPVKLAPGEPVPSPGTLTGNTIASTVKTDKASYENSGGVGNTPVLPPVVTPDAERNAKGTGVLDLPPISKNLIPESSLPMGEGAAGGYDASPTIQSAGPGSTTAALAGAVPLEKDKKGTSATIQSVGPGATTAALAGSVPLEKKKDSVPEVVRESQGKAHFPPEASAVPEEVEEKAAVEKQLLSGVPLAPATSDDTTKESGKSKSTAAGAAAAVGAAATAVGGAAIAYSNTAKDKVTGALPDSVRESISNINETAKKQSVAGIPAQVRESISEAHQSPEAAAYAEPIKEKEEVESELLSEVPKDLSKGESAPKAAAKEEASLPKDAVATDLGDISPGTVPGVEKQTTPAVTTGVASGTAPSTSAAPATPAKDTVPTTTAPKKTSEAAAPSSLAAAAKEAKQKKRRSFFGKLKDKLKDL